MDVKVKKLIDSIYAEKTDIGSAARFFQLNGYRVLHTDFLTDRGKLDLVVTDEAKIIIVLVGSSHVITPSVSLSKRIRLLSDAAAAYKKRFMLRGMPIRFDMFSIDRKNKNILHKPNVFDCYLNY